MMFSIAPNAARRLKWFPMRCKSRFESVLMDFGSQVVAILFHYAEDTERYEDCAEIKRLFEKYHLDLNQSMEDYQAHFWRMGFSGRTAIANINHYIDKAVSLVGYPKGCIHVEPKFI